MTGVNFGAGHKLWGTFAYLEYVAQLNPHSGSVTVESALINLVDKIMFKLSNIQMEYNYCKRVYKDEQ